MFSSVILTESSFGQLLHFSRAETAWRLPNGYGYTAFEASDPVTAYSFSGTLITETTTPEIVAGETPSAKSGRLRVKSFPVRTPSELRKDHCQISHVVVTLASDGKWSIDFLAEMNARLVPAESRTRFVSHHSDQLCVRVRPLLGQRLVTANGIDRVAVPSVASLYVPRFRLKHNSIRQLRADGVSDAVRQHFDRIGHIAIDLSYR